MKGNIYISHLDTPLGYHIAQYFRKDHLELHPSTRIVGTGKIPTHLPWIHAAIDVS